MIISVILWSTCVLLLVVAIAILSGGPVEKYAFNTQITANEILWLIGMGIIFLSGASCLAGTSVWACHSAKIGCYKE